VQPGRHPTWTISRDVRIHYMVGNHDWFYHLPGEAYDALRQKLVEQIGLANRSDRPFPHDITESDELLQTMRAATR